MIVEYPRLDVYRFWSSLVTEADEARLYTGIPFDDFVIRRGLLGYKLSIWDGDARLLVTDRVEEKLADTLSAGQGMGLMLQLGPKWLCTYGDVVAPGALLRNVLAQLMTFGVQEPGQYRLRINRMDIALDLLGLDVDTLSIDEWRGHWIGYAHQKHFHDDVTGNLEGFSIGSSEGAVRFKIYDKETETQQRGTSRFWRSVWRRDELEDIKVGRLEWSVKAYQAKFVGMRYLSDFSFDGFMDILNYVSLKWGRLCVPVEGDSNKSRWDLAPFWWEIRRFIEEWTFNYEGVARRDYDFRPDITPAYLASAAGWIAGLMARLGIEERIEGAAGIGDAITHLEGEGHSLLRKAHDKWTIYSRLVGGDH